METNDINPQFNKAVADFKKVSLTASEKARMRRILMAHMNAHPARGPIVSPISHWILFATRTASVSFVALFAILGSSYAASGSLPGQTLYPIKVGINERVESLLAVTPEASAEVSLKHALTRLDEAEQLAQTGALDASTNATVRARIADDVSRANRQIDSLSSKGRGSNASLMRDSFEQKLDDSFGRFVGIAATSSSTSMPLVADIARDVKSRIDDTSRKTIRAEKAKVAKATKTDAEASARSARDAAMLAIGGAPAADVARSAKAAPTLMMATAMTMSASAPAEASEAQKLLDQGNKKFSEGKFAEAYALFKNAERMARDEARLRDLAPDIRGLIEKKQEGSHSNDDDEDDDSSSDSGSSRDDSHSGNRDSRSGRSED
jgi:hypothetical protein